MEADEVVHLSERLMSTAETVTAYLLVVLFSVGVVDLAVRIVTVTVAGGISDPRVVVGLVDTTLLLFIIVEIYQTVVAYAQEREASRVVRLVIYAGVIAIVRKVIVFRTSEYANLPDALTAALSYTVILVGLALILVVNYRFNR